MATTTLEDLGWKPYWDREGKYPIAQDENFNISPGETKSIFYHCNAVQEEDGKFYGNAFWILGDFPGVMGGIYTSTPQQVDATLVGEGFIGRIEEFALWDRPLDDGEITNYHTNLTGMIGDTVGDKYPTIDDAREDGLTDYYQYGDSAVLQRFEGTQSLSLKNRPLDVTAGKNSNANIVEVADYISLQSLITDSSFTINIRFQIEENGDFTLFDIPETMKVDFDETNSLFRISVYPPTGDAVTVNIEAVNLPNYKWHDLCLSYDGETIKSYLTGVLLESNSYSDGFMPKAAMKLDMTNIEWCSILSARGFGMAVRGTLPYRPVVVESIYKETYNNKTLVNQGRNIDLFIDAKKGVRAASTFMKDRTSNPVTIDPVTFAGSYDLDSWAYYSSNEYNLYEKHEHHEFSISNGTIEKEYSSSYSSSREFIPACQNYFFPGIPIELVVKADSSFTEEFKGVPMVTLPYGCKILVEKTRMLPSLVTQRAHDNTPFDEVYTSAYWSTTSNTSYLGTLKSDSEIASLWTEVAPVYPKTTKVTEPIFVPYATKDRDASVLFCVPEYSSSRKVSFYGYHSSTKYRTTSSRTFSRGARFGYESIYHGEHIYCGPRLS